MDRKIREHIPVILQDGLRWDSEGDICWGCSDPDAGHWVPVSFCPFAWFELNIESVTGELAQWGGSHLTQRAELIHREFLESLKRRRRRHRTWAEIRQERPPQHRRPAGIEDAIASHAVMLSAPRNRGVHNVDDPWNDDGFWRARLFKGSRRTGRPTGGRRWRRNLRHREKSLWRREVFGL